MSRARWRCAAALSSPGPALLDHLSWAFCAFGAFLLIAAVRMARGGANPDPRRGLVLRGLRKVVPVSEDYDGMRFVTRRNGKLAATPLLVVLIAIRIWSSPLTGSRRSSA